MPPLPTVVLASPVMTDGNAGAEFRARLERLQQDDMWALEFAMALGPDNWRSTDARTAIVKQLGASVPGATWASLDSAARAEFSRCVRENAHRDSLDRGAR